MSNTFPNILRIGIVANRTYGWNKLTQQQERDWQKIQDVCQDVAKRGGLDLSFFETTIKDDSKFAKAAADNSLAATDPNNDDVCAAFKGLGKDIGKALKKKLDVEIAPSAGAHA